MQETPQPAVVETPKAVYKKPWFIWSAIAAVALIGVILFTVLGNSSKGSASDIFYKMLETAGQKTKVHFLYELTKGQAQDFPPVYVRSLSEYDSTTHEYSMIYVSESLSVRTERCVKGKEYIAADRSVDTLAQAEAAVAGEWRASDGRFPTRTCQYNQARYQGSFTDGVLPVGATAGQMKNMIDGLKLRNGIAFKDEGNASYNGKKGRKISFEVSKAKTGSEHKANIFFFAYRDGTSSKVAANIPDLNKIDDNFESRLHDSTPFPELKGFYIIDESTSLPIYSELETTAGEIKDFTPTVQRSVYDFPQALTMDAKTPLPKVEKPTN